VGYAGGFMFLGLTSHSSTSRTHGRKRGSSFPLSSYREPRMMTCPLSLKSKRVSRKPQTSRLSDSSGRSAGGVVGVITLGTFVELKSAKYDRLRRCSRPGRNRATSNPFEVSTDQFRLVDKGHDQVVRWDIVEIPWMRKNPILS